MLDRFRKKKEQLEPVVKLVRFEIPEEIRNKIDALEGKEVKYVFLVYLKTLRDTELMDVRNMEWYREHENHDWLAEAWYEEEWKRVWPMGKEAYENTIPDLIFRSDNAEHVITKSIVKELAILEPDNRVIKVNCTTQPPCAL